MGIRLLIVDDHALVREGLRLIFEGTEVDVVAEAADGREAFDRINKQKIDVALVDIRMPRVDGFRLLQMLQDADLKLPVVLMHSLDDGTKSVRRCRELGAKGLVTKGLDDENLLDAIRKVYAGEQVWSHVIGERRG
jgi:DNA-binding NarL/FixJ family response regulator